VKVFINHRRRLLVHGRNITRVALNRLPANGFLLKIIAIHEDRTQTVVTRAYRACRKIRTQTKPHRRRHHRARPRAQPTAA
jgi:hypothetical protein